MIKREEGGGEKKERKYIFTKLIDISRYLNIVDRELSMITRLVSTSDFFFFFLVRRDKYFFIYSRSGQNAK